MGRYICYKDGLFFEWTTISDGPYTFAVSAEKFTDYYLKEYGLASEGEMWRRMERAMERGTSSMMGHTLEELFESCRSPENMTPEALWEYIKNGDEPEEEPTLEQRLAAISEKHRPEMMAIILKAQEYAMAQRELLAKISDPVIREKLRQELLEGI